MWTLEEFTFSQGLTLLVFTILVYKYLFFVLSFDKKPPGPRSGLWNDLNPLGMFFYFVMGSEEVEGRTHELFAKWGKIYGHVTYFRILNAQYYLISEPSLVAEVYSNAKSKVFTSRGKNGMKYFIPKSLLGFEFTDAQWKNHRSLLLGAFTETYLKKYFSTIVHIGHSVSDSLTASPNDSISDCLSSTSTTENNLYSFTKDATTGRILVPDIMDLFNTVTYEVLAHTVLGSEWMSVMSSFGTKEEKRAMLAATDFLYFVPEFLWNIVPIPQKDIACASLSRIRQGASRQISEIRRTGTEGDSMMHFLVHHNKELDDDEVLDELISLVMAGHETTANTLSFCFTSLAYHPEIQTKARREVQQALASSATGNFSYDMLSQVPFVWQIFRETLRLFPTVPANSRVAMEDTVLGSFCIPKGSTVITNNISICRNPIYYDDPLSFVPERWDNEDGLSAEKHLTNLKNFNNTRNFGGGQRFCIGKRFAEEEIVVLLAILLSRFSVALPELPAGSSRVPLLEIPTLCQVTMTLAEPFPLLFEPL